VALSAAIVVRVRVGAVLTAVTGASTVVVVAENAVDTAAMTLAVGPIGRRVDTAAMTLAVGPIGRRVDTAATTVPVARPATIGVRTGATGKAASGGRGSDPTGPWAAGHGPTTVVGAPPGLGATGIVDQTGVVMNVAVRPGGTATAMIVHATATGIGELLRTGTVDTAATGRVSRTGGPCRSAGTTGATEVIGTGVRAVTAAVPTVISVEASETGTVGLATATAGGADTARKVLRASPAISAVNRVRAPRTGGVARPLSRRTQRRATTFPPTSTTSRRPAASASRGR
jgi:hypothetical protein